MYKFGILDNLKDSDNIAIQEKERFCTYLFVTTYPFGIR